LKHVAFRTLIDTTWNASLLGDDVPAAVVELKAQEGRDIRKYGTESGIVVNVYEPK
jgi:hypothetical protein